MEMERGWSSLHRLKQGLKRSAGASTKAKTSPHNESSTARTTCGAVPAGFPPWYVCMNPTASHPTAVAMGPVWMAIVNAPATFGGVPPAAS